MARPDPVAASLVKTAFELHRRRLWLGVPADSPFLVRVPGEEHPLVAVITGQSGTDYGVLLLRGEGAFDAVQRVVSGASDFGQGLDAQPIFCLTLTPLGLIPARLRGVLELAGFQARRESIAPFVFAKRPHEEPRNPSRHEMRLVIACLRAVMAAHDAGELRVGRLDHRRRRILQIAVEGEGKETVTHTQMTAWPRSSVLRAVEPHPDLRALDRGLPRTDAVWVIGLAIGPHAPPDGETGFDVSVLAEAGTREVLSVQAVSQGDARALGKQLADALATGLPRKILIADAGMHAALEPDLVALGIEVELAPDDPDLEAVLEQFADRIAALGAAAEEEADREMPQTLEGWKAAEQRITLRWMAQVDAEQALTPRALSRYFGSEEVAVEVMATLDRLMPVPAVMQWLLADYRATAKSRTILEKRLKKRSTPPVERALIEAQMSARLSIFRVVSMQPGESLEVEDVFDGTRFTVHDRALSGCDVERAFLPLRVYALGEWHVGMVAGPPITAFGIDRTLWLLETLGVELSAQGLRRQAHLVGRLWETMLESTEQPVRLQNTDGHAMVLQTATFRVADADALARALEKQSGVEYDEHDGAWVWSRPGGPGGIGRNTILGRLEMMDDRLVLEVNSKERLAQARAWIERLPGVRFERATARELEREALELDDALPGRREVAAPQMLAGLEELHRKFCFEWLDIPVPMLGGETPRQACKRPEGRRQVEVLVRTMADMGFPGGSLPAPREELLRELGIATRSADGG